MKLAMGVHFEPGRAVVAAVAFDDWGAPEADRSYTCRIDRVEKLARGELDLRALPCLLQLLREHGLAPAVILIDGHVDQDAMASAGLGRHLYHALGSRTAIIGVARTPLPDTPAQFEVFREEEARPLYVSCVGIELGAAKARLRAMHGKRRLPTLLKLVARIAKAAAG